MPIDANIFPIPAQQSLPSGGGAYKEYLSQVEDMIGWNPIPLTSALGRDLQEAIELNNPSAWLAFAGQSIRKAWEALPEDVKKAARDQIQSLVNDALATLEDVPGDLAGAVGESIGNALPLIGALIENVIVAVTSIYKAVKSGEETKRWISKVNLKIAQGDTIDQMEHPDEWVFGVSRVRLYARYAKIRAGGDWDARPSMRSSGAGDLMFTQIRGQDDEGWCDDGVPYKCPQFSDMSDPGNGKLIGCEPKPAKNAGKECIRYIATSALFFPFWSPAYGTDITKNLPGYSYRGEYKSSRAIKLLTERQFALLTLPAVNLQVNGARLRGITDRFKSFWDIQVDTYAPPGANAGLLKIDQDGNAPGTPLEERATIDAKMIKDFVPAKKDKNKFYYDDDGLIHAYPMSGASTSEWGIRSKGGPTAMALSIDQYNAVIGNTLAFFSARANFLRNGPVMRALLKDFGKSYFAIEVQEAMKYAADYGSMLPTSQKILEEPPAPGVPKRAPKKPSRYSPVTFAIHKVQVIDDDKKKPSILPLLLAGGVFAIIALKGKRR